MKDNIYPPLPDVAIDGLVKHIERLRADLAAEREALLTAEMMLSELRVNASEKCQMAYDHLHRHRVGGDE